MTIFIVAFEFPAHIVAAEGAEIFVLIDSGGVGVTVTEPDDI